MNKREIEQQRHMLNALEQLGFDYTERQQLRRISMTLRRWHELECGTGEGQTTRSIERETDEPDSKPFLRVQYPTAHGYVDTRYPIADRETGARKRLERIVSARNRRSVTTSESSGAPLSYFIQGDPRGAALYILRPGDVPEGASADGYYTRGICVY